MLVAASTLQVLLHDLNNKGDEYGSKRLAQMVFRWCRWFGAAATK
jgi:hypothetical protein